MKNQFDIVTDEWLKCQMKDRGVGTRQLAKAVNTSDSKVSQWKSGAPISKIAKAAIYYYFKHISI